MFLRMFTENEGCASSDFSGVFSLQVVKGNEGESNTSTIVQVVSDVLPWIQNSCIINVAYLSAVLHCSIG